MRRPRILMLAAAATLAAITPASAEPVRYATPAPEPQPIEMIVNEVDAVSWMGYATEVGRLEMIVDHQADRATYDLTLRESGERFAMTLTDGGDGSWRVSSDFGMAGSTGFTYEADGSITPGPSTIGDCSIVTDSPLFEAIQAGRAATTAAAGAGTSLRQASHLQQAASALGIVAESINIRENGDCGESAQPNIIWHACSWYPTYDECSDCCTTATEAAATAMLLPCAMAGPVPAGGCAIAVAAALYSCRATCYVYIPDPPDGQEGDECGNFFSTGSCHMLCPADTHDGGQLGCDAPLTCCILNE